MKRATVRITLNFQRNLDGIERYLDERERPAAFAVLLDQLFDKLIPTLESFPEIGADLLARKPGSIEGTARLSALRARLGEGAALRQYIDGDYLVLYALIARKVYLLSIKHHLQLSFDLRGFLAR
jgi:plasmid stabilization system protein ParE